MHDFDVDRAAREGYDRSFKIGGETFNRRASVRPETTAQWESLSPGMAQPKVLKVIDETVLGLIEPGEKGEAHARWKALRERDDDPLNLRDLLDLVPWLIQEQAARPTEPPSNSSDEPVASGTTSTGGSSPRALQAVQEG